MADAPRLLLTAACSAICIGAAGCSKDACTTYQDDVTAKLMQCEVPPASTTPLPSECTPPAAELAQCLDLCLPKINCHCWQDPQGSVGTVACKDINQEYPDCLNKCKNPSGTTSSASGSSSSGG